MPEPSLQEFLDEIRELPDLLGVEFAGVHTRGVLGDTPLHVAAIRGDARMVGLLLDAGAEIDAHGEYGHTPLHEAIGQMHIEVVRLLLARGASRTVTNDWGQSALDIARLGDKPEIEALLRD